VRLSFTIATGDKHAYACNPPMKLVMCAVIRSCARLSIFTIRYLLLTSKYQGPGPAALPRRMPTSHLPRCKSRRGYGAISVPGDLGVSEFDCENVQLSDTAAHTQRAALNGSLMLGSGLLHVTSRDSIQPESRSSR